MEPKNCKFEYQKIIEEHFLDYGKIIFNYPPVRSENNVVHYI
jgi:hypothetical protein